MTYHDSVRFATNDVLQFVLYRARCIACVLTQQYRMDLPLATVVGGLFTGGAMGCYPRNADALPGPVLDGRCIRIVNTDEPSWQNEFTKYGMAHDRVDLLHEYV